jgi:chromosome segregation ATPase
LEQKNKEQHDAIKLQDDENKNLLKELENCRINAIKEVAKIKDGFAESLAEVKEKGSRQAELLKQQVKRFREQSESLTLELEERNHHKQELQKEKYAELSKENSQLSEQLRDAEREIAQLKESTEHSNKEDLAKRLEKKVKSEKVLRVEMAQLRSEIARKNSNEKHLEDHVASLEKQINELVCEYESKLQLQVSNGGS